MKIGQYFLPDYLCGFARNFPPVIIALFIGYVAVELFGDRTIETVNALAVTPNPVHPGQTATVVYQGRQDNNCDGIVHRWIIDSKGTLIQLDDAGVLHHDIVDPGKIFTFTKTFNVPLGLNPGPATYNSEAVRWCNSWQQFLWPVRDRYTVSFEVAK